MDLEFVKEENGRFLFAYPSRDGLFYLVFGIFLLSISLTDFIPNILGRILASIIGLILIFVGYCTFAWRHRLEVNSRSRRFQRVFGTWPLSVKTENGTYADIIGLVLAVREYRYDNSLPEWSISLSFRDLDQAFTIDETCDEEKAQKKLVDWSHRLGIEICDKGNVPGSRTIVMPSRD